MSETVGERACGAIATLGVATVPTEALAPRAFVLAARHRVSAYDGLYLALAQTRGAVVHTFDAALVRKAVAAGLGALVEAPPPVMRQAAAT